MSKEVHVRRSHIHIPPTIGALIADKVVAAIGSWKFIITQTVILLLWAILNSVGWFPAKWDLYPFIAMNLLLSCQAAYASPLIMMSQNRQATKDRVRDDTEAYEVDQLVKQQEEIKKLQEEARQIQEELRDMTLQQNGMLAQHKQILDQQSEMLALLKLQSEARLRKRKIPLELPTA